MNKYAHGPALDDLLGTQLSAWAKQRLESGKSAPSEQMEDTMYTQFTSLDGITVELHEGDRIDTLRLHSLMFRVLQGYGNVIRLKGAPGLTELCMYTKCAYKNGIVAFANKEANYAYVLFEDKSVVDGSFHQFADGTWNIS